MTTRKAVWRIGVTLFYVAVVLTVLSFVHQRPEATILPILGILYVMIRGTGNMLGITVLGIRFSVERIERRLEARDTGAFLEREPEFGEARDKTLSEARWGLMIEAVGLWVISLICLWKFFVALGVL